MTAVPVGKVRIVEIPGTCVEKCFCLWSYESIADCWIWVIRLLRGTRHTARTAG